MPVLEPLVGRLENHFKASAQRQLGIEQLGVVVELRAVQYAEISGSREQLQATSDEHSTVVQMCRRMFRAIGAIQLAGSSPLFGGWIVEEYLWRLTPSVASARQKDTPIRQERCRGVETRCRETVWGSPGARIR